MNKGIPLMRYILAGIRHRPGRNIATVFCFAFIAATIFSAQFLVAGTAGTLGLGASRMGADLLVIPSQYAALVKGSTMGPVSAVTIIRVEPSDMRINLSAMDTIGTVTDVAAMSPQVYVATLGISEGSPSPVDVYGIDPVTDFTIRPWLQQHLKKTLGNGEILVGNDIRGATLSTVTIGSGAYTITGRLDPTRSAVDRSVFMTLEDAFALAAEPGVLPPGTPPVRPGEVNAILVKTEAGADSALVGARVQQPFSHSYIKVLDRHFALKPASRAIEELPAIINAIAIIVMLAAFPLIALVAAMVANERRREIGLLVAMGASRNVVFLLVIAESLVLAAAGGITGVVASRGIFFMLTDTRFFPLPVLQGFEVPSVAETAIMAAGALGLVTLMGSLAALWPAWRSSRMNPYDAIRSGT